MIRSYCQMKGWEQVPILVLGEAGAPKPDEDYLNYPNYVPFAHKREERKAKKKPMRLSIV
jgi:hypothetical protein